MSGALVSEARVGGAGARRARSRLAGAALAGAALAAAPLVAGCDPCAGVASCEQAPRLGVSGQIVDRGDPTEAARLAGGPGAGATPSGGVRVEVVRTDGVELDAARAAATTDGSGWWQVSIPAREEGGVTVDVLVTPPGGLAYRVRGLNLRTSRKRGDGTVLGRWTREPYLTMLGEVFTAPAMSRVEGARVTAVRRGGIEVAPTPNTQSPMVTVGGGRFLFDVRPLADGPLVLDFTVERDGLPPATVRGVTLLPQHEWLPPNVSGDLIFRLDAAGNRFAN